MGLYSTEAIVLGYRNLGEADKILTLFSPDKGKMHAVARGVRRPRNRLLGGTQLFSYTNFLLISGKNLDTICQCEIRESFYKLRDKLDNLAYGLYFAELLRVFTPLEDKNWELFNFFLKTLYCIERWNDMEKLSRIFELKLMALQGFTPEFFCCTNCGAQLSGNVMFSPKLGGALCINCSAMDRKAIEMLPEALIVLRKMLKGTYEQLESLVIRESIGRNIKEALYHFILCHTDRKLKSLQFLTDIKSLRDSSKQKGEI
jgi:DNA repair protein RecO (recombination protein O)